MGLLHHPRAQLRDLLERTVAERWPGERLLLVAPCARRSTGEAPAWPKLAPPPETATGSLQAAPTVEHEPGVLGVTELRIVYQRQARHGLVPRVAAVALAVIGVLAIASGHFLPFVVAGVIAGALWVASRVVEGAATGRRWLAFHQIEDLDPDRREIRGRAGRGRRRRFWIHDAGDFLAIRSLVFGRPAGSYGS